MKAKENLYDGVVVLTGFYAEKKGVLLELQNEDEIKYYKHPQGTSTKENRVKEMKFVS